VHRHCNKSYRFSICKNPPECIKTLQNNTSLTTDCKLNYSINIGKKIDRFGAGRFLENRMPVCYTFR
jgi:hypothetical protein